MKPAFADIRYAEHEGCLLDIYLVAGAKKTLLYFHGGGLESGEKAYSELFGKVIEKGISVISAGYRLYPSAKYPDFVNDAADAVKWVMDNHKKYGYGDEVYVMGSSAGAYLAAMFCFDEHYFTARGVSGSRIKGYLLDDPQPTVHFNILRERGIDSRRVIVDEAAPLYHVAEKIYPKIVLVSYDKQTTFPARFSQNALISKTMEQYNIVHKFYALDGDHCCGENADSGFSILKPLFELLGLNDN